MIWSEIIGGKFQEFNIKRVILLFAIITVILVSGCVSDTGQVTKKETNVPETIQTQPEAPITNQPECTPSYKCSGEFSECFEPGFRVEFCTDENKCGKDYIIEGYAKDIIKSWCQSNPSKDFCQKNVKMITEQCDYIKSGYKVGDEITTSAISFKVNSFKFEDMIINEEYPEISDFPKTGYKYLITDITIKNLLDKEYYLAPAYDFSIIDNKEFYTYSYAMVVYLEQELPTGDIQPGRTIRGNVAFEVPEDVSDLSLQYSSWMSNFVDIDITVNLQGGV